MGIACCYSMNLAFAALLFYGDSRRMMTHELHVESN